MAARSRLQGVLTSAQTWTLLSALVGLFGVTVASILAQQASLRGFLQSRFDTVGAQFDAVGARFDAVGARFDGLEQATGARFDAVAARFDGLEQASAARFDGLEQATAARFSAVDAKLESLDRDVQALSGRVFGQR